jgi:hypothetical protein
VKPWIKELERTPVVIANSNLASPEMTYLTAEEKWRLDADYTYHHEGHAITVLTGFETDLASVPRPLWWLIAPFELSIAAPLIHDFLYRFRSDPPADQGSIDPPRLFARKECDVIFRKIMEEEGVKPWRRAAAYSAVRALGWIPWMQAA